MNLVTLGVYGFTAEAFFAALAGAGVDTFCDLRWRRGVRGAEYAFANSARLQRRLAAMGIRYRHFRQLAPSPALRQRQYESDQAAGTTKRQRAVLGESFVAGYRAEYLRPFDSRQLVGQLDADATTVALFCVEREPAACHRSLVAERWQQDLGGQVIHLLPPTP